MSRGRWSLLFGVALTLAMLPSAASTSEAIVRVDELGMVNPTTGQWHLRNDSGGATSFYFGNPGDLPIYGDWNCDGVDTPGMYRQSDGYVYLRNSNTQGVGDVRFFFGNPGDIPLAGDFNGNGCATVSIYRPATSQVFIINKLGGNEGGLGQAEFSYYFGNPGDKPFVGDFDGDGVETIGLHRESTGLVYFRNSHTEGVADNEFIYGDPGDRLVAGDWTGNSIDSPGLFRPANTTWYLRWGNSQGVADESFVWGQPGWLPIVGEFGQLAATPTDVLIADDFETYPVGAYPSAGGWYTEWSGRDANVSDAYAHTGNQSFRLSGVGGWVRTDALLLDLSRAERLTYEVAIYCSSEDANCAEVGFFVRTKPNESWAYNSFHLHERRHQINVKGTGPRIGGPPDAYEVDTGLVWEHDRWYVLRSEIDYAAGTVDFWIDGEQVGENLIAAPREATNIFQLATNYGYEDAVVYFDDVRIEIVNTAE